MDPALGIIESGDLLIDRDKIIAVGRDIGSWAVREIDGRGMIAMPGFINGHIHLWQTALRGIAADWTLDQYFGVLIGKAVRLYTPQDAYIGNLVGALDQINSGITTLFDWCPLSGRTKKASTNSRPTAVRKKRKPDIGLMASFHVACAKHGPRPQSMQSLAQQHLLGPDINLVHANFLTPNEFRVVANNGTSVSITAEVEMQMGLGIPPTGAALAAHAKLNIGTDVTGVSTDMFTQMRFLLQTQRALVNETFHKRETMPDRLTMTARQVLELATIKSAQCIGLDRRIGSLSPGKQADVVLLRETDINMRAAADPIAAIVLHAGVGNVDTAIINGNIVKQDGKLTYRELGRRLTELERSSERLHAGFASDASVA
jgi:5-methylthioadenosine/S-adenosylhomocysteine deaminase